MIRSGDRIIVYGLGADFRDCERVLREHLNIVACSDRWQRPMDDYWKNRFVNYTDIMSVSFDQVLITTSKYYDEAKDNLLSMGVPEEKILDRTEMNAIHKIKEAQTETPGIFEDKAKLHMSVINGGGFGDGLLDMVFIKKIYEKLHGNCEVVYVCNLPDFFQRFPFVSGSLDYNTYKKSFSLYSQSDLLIRMHRIPMIEKWDESVVRQYDAVIATYCKEMSDLFEEKFSRIPGNYRYSQYALAMGKNRLQQADVLGILGIEPDEELPIPISGQEEQIVTDLGLRNVSYVTVNCETGGEASQSTKSWPAEYYLDLLKKIKLSYPQVKTVLLGTRSALIGNAVDIDLSGKTTLGESAALLRHAMVHLGGEGGLTHLMHFVGGVSIVLFGPTDPKIFGYINNLNLQSDACGVHCDWLVDDWNGHCMKGDMEATCMKALKPEVVFDAFRRFMEK